MAAYLARLTAARNPDTRIVIDHLGLLQPFEPPKPAEPWADLPKLVALVRYDNVVVKISGAGTLAKEPFPYKDIWDPLRRIFDAFGMDRCLSDSDRARLTGGTVRKVYGWAPSPR
jgi:L-fuconolactonase